MPATGMQVRIEAASHRQRVSNVTTARSMAHRGDRARMVYGDGRGGHAAQRGSVTRTGQSWARSRLGRRGQCCLPSPRLRVAEVLRTRGPLSRAGFRAMMRAWTHDDRRPGPKLSTPTAF
jgi:hypothetical protein